MRAIQRAAMRGLLALCHFLFLSCSLLVFLGIQVIHDCSNRLSSSQMALFILMSHERWGGRSLAFAATRYRSLWNNTF